MPVDPVVDARRRSKAALLFQQLFRGRPALSNERRRSRLWCAVVQAALAKARKDEARDREERSTRARHRWRLLRVYVRPWVAVVHQQRVVLNELKHLLWLEKRLDKTTSSELLLCQAEFEALRRLKHEDGI